MRWSWSGDHHTLIITGLHEFTTQELGSYANRWVFFTKGGMKYPPSRRKAVPLWEALRVSAWVRASCLPLHDLRLQLLQRHVEDVERHQDFSWIPVSALKSFTLRGEELLPPGNLEQKANVWGPFWCRKSWICRAQQTWQWWMMLDSTYIPSKPAGWRPQALSPGPPALLVKASAGQEDIQEADRQQRGEGEGKRHQGGHGSFGI